ncbi:phage holin family protein [Aridibaculum aurantiacum]|uniref:phage holin family protein n=1 Tax=Aridibaculum aurantiacum TaxID=2810307 RepID=UPI001A95CA59|nr:phage holin family protein [Aridibaculum aurantiacum]
MHRIIIKILITAIAVLIASWILPAVTVNSSWTAIVVALVLGLLNAIVRPILILLTIPITIFTLGLFLLVINILIIMWTSDLVPGFRVGSWFSALLFSFIVSISSSLIEAFFGLNRKEK